MRSPERTALATASLAVGIALFGITMATRDAVNPWLSNAAVALVVGSVAAVLLGPRLRTLFAFRPGPVLVAAALGAVMVGLTHLGYRIAAAASPALGQTVEGLYGDISDAPNRAVTVGLVIAIVVTEELLWRGLAVELLGRRASPAWIAAAAVALYALPQIIGGSAILVCAAVVLGLVFTIQRLITARLTEPVVTHAIWGVSVFALVPVTGV